VARRFGALRFLAFYVTTAAAGAATHLAVHFGEVQPMIGASAAVSGAMAAAMRFAFQRGGPLGIFGRGEDSAYRVPAAPLSAMLRDPRLLVFLLVWFSAICCSGQHLCPGGTLPGRRMSAASSPASSALRCSSGAPAPSLGGAGPDDEANVH
jgi:hypothetical protein